jgi:hypothetical protein
MDVINSQNLAPGEHFLQKFTLAGTYNWGVYNIGQNVVTVADPPNAQPKTWNINLLWDGTQFEILSPDAPDATNLAINTKDNVVWQSIPKAGIPSNKVPVFSIVGTNFSSRALAANAVYSHVFILPGNYQYLVSGLTGGPMQGLINVSANVNPPYNLWPVTITDGTPLTPPTINPNPVPPPVYVGDTVQWAIAAGSSIVIKNS